MIYILAGTSRDWIEEAKKHRRADRRAVHPRTFEGAVLRPEDTLVLVGDWENRRDIVELMVMIRRHLLKVRPENRPAQIVQAVEPWIAKRREETMRQLVERLESA